MVSMDSWLSRVLRVPAFSTTMVVGVMLFAFADGPVAETMPRAKAVMIKNRFFIFFEILFVIVCCLNHQRHISDIYHSVSIHIAYLQNLLVGCFA